MYNNYIDMKFIDFMTQPSKKVIIDNNLGDITNIIKSFVISNNTSFFNFERFNINQIAKTILYTHYNNFIYIDTESSLALFYAFLSSKRDGQDIYNLIPDSSFNFESAKVCLSTINEIRNAKRINKNQELDLLINDYESFLLDKNYYDDALIINKAIELINKLDVKDIKTIFKLNEDYSIAILDTCFYELTYLERSLLDTLVNKLNVKYEIVSIYDKNDNLSIKAYKTYGFYQEVENIINIIDQNKISLQDVEIIISNPSYTNIIKSYFDNYHIPYVFDYGDKLTCFNVYGFISSIIDFLSNHYSIKYLYDIYRNYSLKNEYKNIKELKNLHADINQIKLISQSWEDSPKTFINDLLDLPNYSNVSDIYNHLLDLIYKYLKEESYIFVIDTLKSKKRLFDLYDSLNLEDEPLDLIKRTLESITIDSPLTSSTPIVIKKLTKVKYLFKKHVFILGLSSSQLHLKEVESPLLNDEGIKKIVDYKNYYVELASNKNKKYNDKLDRLIKYNSSSNVYLSYSEYDSTEFKVLSPSVFFIKNASNINDPLINESLKLDAFNIDKDEEIIDSNSFNKCKENLYMSPTRLNTLYNCPLNYIYQKTYDEIDLDEYDNTWLKGNEKGTLVHAILENYYLANLDKKYNKASLDEIFDRLTKEEISKHPFDDVNEINEEISSIRKSINKYIKYTSTHLDSYKILGCEIEFSKIEIELNGKKYKFFGTVDRVDYYNPGTGELYIRIYDYKTGKEKSLDNDGLTQSFIYKYAIDDYLKKNDVKAIVGDFDLNKIKYEFAYIYLNEYNSTKFVSEDEVNKNIQANSYKLSLFNNLKNSVDSFFDVYKPKTIKDSDFADSRCKYCNYVDRCILKKRTSANTVWSHEKYEG